jgi:hypothetical protein
MTSSLPLRANAGALMRKNVCGSYGVPVRLQELTLATSTRGKEVLTTTGAFKNILPEIHAGPTHYKRALKSLANVKIDESMRNVRNKQRKYCAQTLDAVMKGLTIPITKTLDAYKFIFTRVHPYEVLFQRIRCVHPYLKKLS